MAKKTRDLETIALLGEQICLKRLVLMGKLCRMKDEAKRKTLNDKLTALRNQQSALLVEWYARLSQIKRKAAK
jgi:hypothetical protein